MNLKLRAYIISGLGVMLLLLTLHGIDPNSGIARAAPPSDTGRIYIARFDADDKLILPADLDQWVFMGSSLGMGYSETDFDETNPGMFQITLMEPTAYAYFIEHQDYAEGTMFVLNFYGSKQRLSTNRSGFVMGGLMASEMHLLDSDRFKDGHNFYSFGKNSKVARVMPDGNGCVTCHDQNAAFKATFAQFYPAIRHHLPEGILEASVERGTERLE